MSERTTELTPQEAAHQSAVLYETEKLTHTEAALSLDALGGEEVEDDGGEQRGERAQFDDEVHQQAVAESNEFGEANRDALHEAAIQEAAQRVADVYESQDAQRTPDPQERADP